MPESSRTLSGPVATRSPPVSPGALRDALAMWRGAAYVEVADERWAHAEAERLEELRLAAIEARIDAELSLGRHAALVPELELLAARHTTRERLVGHLMVALYRCGRQADALAAYHAARASLVDELGLEPGPELRGLQAAVLAQDAALRLAADEPPAPPVVDKAALPAAGERKQVTVLFADVVDSMGLAERLDPEELHSIMHRCFSILSAGVHRLEGTVDKFTGDGIMAIFGAPIAHEDHARRACYAALHVQRELTDYAEELRAEGLEFAVRIGLNSGEVVVGAIGPDLAMDYTAIGVTVGLAQRMEQLAAPGTVYTSEATASLVAGYFDLDDLGAREVKGVRHPVRVHRLIGVGAARTRLDTAGARGLSGFVGRGGDLGALGDACRRGFAERGQLVGVVGEPGVGKSRLCHEFAEQQRAEGVPVYRIAGQAHAKAVPLLPVLEFLRTFFGITEDDADAVARERIAARLLDLDENFDDELPLVFDFLAVADPDRPVERMDPEARQRRLLAFMKHLTHAQGAREPTVTVIEDLHWLDPASEAFLANHVEAVNGTRGCTIVNFRPEYRAEWMARSYYRQIALEPLESGPTDALLDELLGPDPSLAELRELIRTRTQGNPFFIEELVQSLIEAGPLEGTPGAFTSAGPLDEAAVPATVQVVLAARIDRLASVDKTVLQAAAVVGREFPRSVLQKVLVIDATELDAALAHLVAAELVYEQDVYPEPVFTFKHPLTAEVAYRTQLADHRAALHAAVARAMTEHYPADQLEERAALLAGHWEAARETLEAARWHARAAAWSGTTDPVESLRHWHKVRGLADALPESQEVTSLGLSARIASLNYGWRLGISPGEAERLFNEAEGIASTAGDIASRAILLSVYALIRGTGYGDLRECARLTLEAMALADESGDRALTVAVAVMRGYALFCIGEHREAVAICDRAIALADGDPAVGVGILVGCPHAGCLAFRGLCLGNLGELDEARRALEQGRKFAREQGDIETVGHCDQISTHLAYLSGEPDAALAHGEQALDNAERTGSAQARTWAWFFLGLAQRMQGEWQRAIEAVERSSAIAKEGRIAAEGDGWRLALLGESYLGLGDHLRALALAEKGVESARASGHSANETHANLAVARILLGSAGGPAAREQIEAALARALELASDTGAKAFEPLIHVELAELAHQLGDEQGHRRELHHALRAATDIGATGHADRLSAQLATPAG